MTDPQSLDCVHHVAVNVSDIPRSVRWYCSSFRCTVEHEDKTHAILRFANIRLTLTLPSAEPMHLAFEREDASTFGELRPRIESVRSTFVADPAGNVIEIIERPSGTEPEF